MSVVKPNCPQLFRRIATLSAEAAWSLEETVAYLREAGIDPEEAASQVLNQVSRLREMTSSSHYRAIAEGIESGVEARQRSARSKLATLTSQDSLSLGWRKAQIVLGFAGRAIFASAFVFVAVLYLNKDQTLKNHEADVGYIQDFRQDIASENPTRQAQAFAILRVMSPRLATQLVPVAAKVDPIIATSRSVEISSDRSQDSETRTMAEQSRRKIMDTFRVTDPAYEANVEARQMIHGTTPFRGMRHYIIVTTPQGVDFVTSEARVSGDSWEGPAIFGEAGAGGNEKFSVRVIATTAALPEGPLVETPPDAMSSNSIAVIRQP